MYVCICHAVTQGQVQAAIDGGACTVGDVTRVCKAGGDCGSCHAMIDGMIDARADRSGPIPAMRIVRPRAA